MTLSGHTVLFLHAHPDDEAIFSGLTLRRLADAGARTVLVCATGGELGGSRVPLRPGETVPQRRVAELERAAELLGVARLVLLGGRDSGLPGGPGAAHPRALASAARLGAARLGLARRVAGLLDAEGAATVVHDDDGGIYGHPDHRAVHRIGLLAAALTGATAYRTTVDREHLRTAAPDVHLVHGAARAAGTGYGRATAEIALAVTGTAHELAVKRAAICAHASQLAPGDVPGESFTAAYGYEWYRRSGPPASSTRWATPTCSPDPPGVAACSPRARRLDGWLCPSPTSDPPAAAPARPARVRPPARRACCACSAPRRAAGCST
jgi:LmbE family N-acetylglucosaminyl deacetylase